jgi:hypothetical protein
MLFAAVAGGAVPRPDHVVVVVEENHSLNSIIGSNAAAYINGLAGQGALFTRSFALTHPSQPNYLALFSGSTQGVIDDSGPNTFTAPNLGGELIAARRTFAGYSEDLPYAGYTGLKSNGYSRKHSPWTDFTDVPASANQPLTAFPTDYANLPTVSFVIPTKDHNMHDGSIQAGDAWLRDHLDGYAQWAKTHHSQLIVTWDEDDDSQSNQIPTFIVGQGVTPGRYAEQINHYSILRTLEDMYGLGHAGRTTRVAPITDIFAAGGGGGADVTPPSATLYAPRLRTGGAARYTFSVTYRDDAGVVPGTMDGADLLVSGPGGYSQAARLEGVNRYRSGTPRIATYSGPAPDGVAWRRSDNGAYGVAIRARQVSDVHGNYAAAGVLGSFSVRIRRGTARAAVVTGGAVEAVATIPQSPLPMTTAARRPWAFAIDPQADVMIDS